MSNVIDNLMTIFVQKHLSAWNILFEHALSDEGKNKIKMMLDGGNMLFFFKYNQELFGASENSRVVFAKFKDQNDEDADSSWRKEASFSATNLNKAVLGQNTQTIFTSKEIPNIEVMPDKTKVYDELVSFVEAQ